MQKGKYYCSKEEDIGGSLENINGMLNQIRISRKLDEAVEFGIRNFTNLGDDTHSKLFEQYLKNIWHQLVNQQ
ncbi:hypothetical protein ACIQ34_06670 [Ureibacillus sp. NPDC094379]